MSDEPSMIAADIQAVQDAVEALNDQDIRVTNVDTIDRDNPDKEVQFELTCTAETRTANISDFEQ